MSIQVRHLHKHFGSFKALDDVSLDFGSGELVALLGPSGCGKTTLLRIIAGLEHPDQGDVLLDGHSSLTQAVQDRRVGFVFQHYALFKHMTVFDNVAFGLRMKPRADRPSAAQIRDKVMSLLALVQLEPLAERFPAQLSGGQRQRIALARALAVEPKVLLLDEPFGALDAKVRKELRRWLRRLHDELQVTSIFVTHDQEEALEVADHVVLMNQGRVEQMGSPEEVYQRPASPFVHGFLGAVNRFQGRIGSGTLQIGAESLTHDAQGRQAVGAQVLAFVRPHELAIDVDYEQGEGIAARVTRVLSFGLTTRIELEGIAGEERPHFDVELTRTAADALALQVGQHVRLRPARLDVYEREGYRDKAA